MPRYLFAHTRSAPMQRSGETTLTAPAPTTCRSRPRPDAEDLVNSASADAPERMTVVFTTYQSMQVIADAHKAGLPAFDLVICDEAHRTTGALRGGRRFIVFS